MELKVYILCGAPGSGKSTWSKNFVNNNSNVVRLCPDEFRSKFGWGEGDQSVSAKAFEATKEATRDALKKGTSVIIDATNMHQKARRDFLNMAHKYQAETIAVVFECTKQTLLDRNKKRGDEGGRIVPEDVIDRMLGRYQRPDENEFDKVMFVSDITP
jgi:predicted kinase